MNDWSAGSYKTGDEEEIARLFERVFGEKQSNAHWEWKFKGLPGASDHISLIKDENGDVIGHLACIPLGMKYRGKDVQGGTVVDFMVDPGESRRGAGGLLLDTMIGDIRDDLSLSYGFPNANSVGLSKGKDPGIYMGEIPVYWRVESVTALIKRYAPGLTLPPLLKKTVDQCLRMLYSLLEHVPCGRKEFRVDRHERFEARLGELTDNSRRGCGIYIERSPEFLAWRYDSHPDKQYTLLSLFNAGGKPQPIGFAVLTIKEYKGFRLGFIVDIMVQKPMFKSARYLLIQAVNWFRASGAEVISCVMTGKNAYTRALASLGFARIPQKYLPGRLHMLVRVFDKGIDKDFISEPSNWFLAWADTDLV